VCIVCFVEFVGYVGHIGHFDFIGNLSFTFLTQKVVSDAIETAQALVTQLESRLAAATSGHNKAQTDFDKFKAEESKAEQTVRKESKGWEKRRARRQVLERTKDECTRKIRELGALPSSADKFKKLTQPQVMGKLETVNKKLTKFSHVNKKALDQYLSFADQREELLGRRKELDKGTHT
jgi:structural maintenance of chromosome 3 (chondroitin sulfate proteoglycan 6)